MKTDNRRDSGAALAQRRISARGIPGHRSHARPGLWCQGSGARQVAGMYLAPAGRVDYR